MFVLRDDASRGTIIRAAHCAHRVPVCSTVTVLLCGGNDCRCRRKALVGMTGCKMQINKQTFFFFFITLDDKSVVPLTFDSSQPTCTDLCLGATLFFSLIFSRHYSAGRYLKNFILVQFVLCEPRHTLCGIFALNKCSTKLQRAAECNITNFMRYVNVLTLA